MRNFLFSHKMMSSSLDFQKKVIENNPIGQTWSKAYKNNPTGEKQYNNLSEAEELRIKLIDLMLEIEEN